MFIYDWFYTFYDWVSLWPALAVFNKNFIHKFHVDYISLWHIHKCNPELLHFPWKALYNQSAVWLVYSNQIENKCLENASTVLILEEFDWDNCG